MIIIFGILLFLTVIAIVLSIGTNKNKKTPVSSIRNTSVVKGSSNPNHFKKRPLFIETWSYEEFCKKFDKMQCGNPINRTTGESFRSCRFFKRGEPVTYVGFYKVPRELTIEEIKRRAKELRVGLKESGRYLIYTGDMPIDESEPVDLGI